MAVVCLLVLLGAAFASCGPIPNVPTDLEKIHKSIVNDLKLATPEIGSDPLFTSVIRSLNNSCQADVMLMNATLDVYMRILNSFPQHQEPVSELKELKRHMHKLKSGLSHHQQNKEDLISKINAIEVNDSLVQKKALAEYLDVYRAASGLLHSLSHRYAH